MFHRARYVLKKTNHDPMHDNMFMTQSCAADENNIYNKEGQVVPYYIVGNTQAFLKLKLNQQVEESSKEHIKQYKSTQRKPTHQDDDSDYIKVDLDASEVEKEIETAIKQNCKGHEEILHNKMLSKGDQVYEQREGKIIEKFQAREIKWNKRIIQSAQQCNRAPIESLFHHIQADRAKKEDKHLLELIQSDAEKYGNKLWQKQLRADQVPNAVLEKQQKMIEIVRKPNSANVYKRPQIYQQRFDEKKDIVDQLLPSQSMQNLEVIGHSKLVKETASLLHLLKQDTSHHVSHIQKTNKSSKPTRRQMVGPFIKVKQREQPIYYHEILEMQYDKGQLRQQGKLDICKQIF